MKYLRLIWLVALLFVLLPSTQAQEDELDEVSIIVGPYNGHAPFFIAAAEGYFEEQGIDIDLQVLPNPSEGLVLFLQGEVDVLAASVSNGLMNSMIRGGEISFVAGMSQFNEGECTQTGIFIRREDEDTILSLGDLKGASLVLPDGITLYVIDREFQKAGFSILDVTSENLPPSGRIDALVNGGVDAAFISEPWVTRALQTGDVVELVALKDLYPALQLSGVLFGQRLLDDEDLAVRVLTAYLQGVHQFNEGPTERNIEILSEPLGIEPEILEAMCWNTISETGSLNTESIQNFIGWAYQNELIDEEFDIADYYTPQLAEAAAEALPPTEE